MGFIPNPSQLLIHDYPAIQSHKASEPETEYLNKQTSC
jgi:hypothetical protein